MSILHEAQLQTGPGSVDVDLSDCILVVDGAGEFYFSTLVVLIIETLYA